MNYIQIYCIPWFIFLFTVVSSADKECTECYHTKIWQKNISFFFIVIEVIL